MPTTQLPDSIYIPSRFVYQSNLNENIFSQNEIETTAKSTDELINYYCNAVDYLSNYFLKFCTSIDSIGKILSLSSTISYNNLNSIASNPTSFNNTSNNNNLLLHSTFDIVTLSNCFETKRIQSLHIIETSLLKTLQNTSNFYLKPKTGYCALYKNENIILVMDSEPKTNKLSLAGL